MYTEDQILAAEAAIRKLAEDGQPLRAIALITSDERPNAVLGVFSPEALLVRYRGTPLEDEIHKGQIELQDWGEAGPGHLLAIVDDAKMFVPEATIQDALDTLTHEQKLAPKGPHDLDGRTFMCEGERVQIHAKRYDQGNGLALVLTTLQGEPYATLSVNLEDLALSDNQIAVRTWGAGERVAKAALESGLFEESGMRMPTGYVSAEVWNITGGQQQLFRKSERTR